MRKKDTSRKMTKKDLLSLGFKSDAKGLLFSSDQYGGYYEHGSLPTLKQVIDKGIEQGERRGYQNGKVYVKREVANSVLEMLNLKHI